MIIRILSTTLLVSLMATSAQALDFIIVNLESTAGTVDSGTNTVSGLTAGDAGATITMDILIDNAATDNVAVLGLSINNWEGDGVVGFNDGNSTPSVLNALCSGPGACFGGIPNATQPNLVFDVVNNENVVNVIAAAASANSAGDGGDDVSAIDDQQFTGDAGQAHARVTFTVSGTEGTTVLGVGKVASFDAVSDAGGVDVPVTNETVTITVPEPGSLGMGLAALGTVGAVVGLRRRED